MYVFCVGMYRSCSTWQYQIASHLVETHLGGQRLGFLFGDQFADHDRAPPQPDWQVLKSHDAHPAFARALAEGRAVALHSYRDLRDVVFSLMHKFDVPFGRLLLKDGLLESCLANDKFWTGQLNVLCQRYEDIILDPAEAVRRLAHHLQIPLAENEADDLAQQYSFTANLQRVQAVRERLSISGVDLCSRENSLASDPHSLLHWNHMRHGRAADWRHEANRCERAELAKICGDWLIARGYERDLGWVEASPDDAWRQFDFIRHELAQARRKVVELESHRAELAKLQQAQSQNSQDRLRQSQKELAEAKTELARMRADLAGAHGQLSQLEAAQGAAAARIVEQDLTLAKAIEHVTALDSRLAEAEQRKAELRALLAEAESRLGGQDSLVRELRLRIAELETLGPLTLKVAGQWRRLARQHPQACAALRPMARRVLRLLAS